MKIFVTVGTRPNQFDRLVREMDNIGRAGGNTVFIQTGNSAYTPKNARFKRFIGYSEQLKKIEWCDVAVSHAGAGSIIEILARGKPLVLFPRLKKYGEHTNDHQIDLCGAIKRKYGVEYSLEGKNLPRLIKTAKKRAIKLGQKRLAAKVIEILNGK